MSSSNGAELPEESTRNFDLAVEQELLDSDLAMRTAMYFGLELSKEEAFNKVGVPLGQQQSWAELWDDLEKEEMRKILASAVELDGDKFFVRRNLYRLRPPRDPQEWSFAGWETSEFLVEALKNRRESFNSINFYDAYDSYPEAFPEGDPKQDAHSTPTQDALPSQSKLSDESGMPVHEFIQRAKQQSRDESERILDIVAGRSELEVDEYFEGSTLLRLTPSLETQVWSNGAWENDPSLIHELREGRLPEAIHLEEIRTNFPEVF